MKVNWSNKKSLRRYYRNYRKNNRDAANKRAARYRDAHRAELSVRNKEYRNRKALGMTLEEYRNLINKQ